MTAYYNEIDPYAAQWLRNLIDAGHIADGIVDERSIIDVEAADLSGFTQCHFFAGLGGWSHALRLAGWNDSRPVWTGSPPCQPFSTAGKQAGKDDSRHLAPHWLELVTQCRPANIFGEQVSAAINHGWSDDLQSHLEAENYAFGMVVLPACGVGAPHIRQRLWLVAERLADANGEQRHKRLQPVSRGQAERTRGDSESIWMDDADNSGSQEHRELGELHLRQSDGEDTRRQHINPSMAGGLADGSSSGHKSQSEQHPAGIQREVDGSTGARVEPCPLRATSGGLADTASSGSRAGLCDSGQAEQRRIQPADGCGNDRPGPTNGFWRSADWLGCRDGKWRPVESGTFPLANGVPARVGKLRAYGNAIVPQVAAEVITAYMETR